MAVSIRRLLNELIEARSDIGRVRYIHRVVVNPVFVECDIVDLFATLFVT